MPFDFGDVVLVPFPFTSQTASKKRPAIVVSSRAYSIARPDLIVMSVTSMPKTAQHEREFPRIVQVSQQEISEQFGSACLAFPARAVGDRRTAAGVGGIAALAAPPFDRAVPGFGDSLVLRLVLGAIK
jgi:mRNA-degrading endonuclease toxin of MazEF toxin-antitoxin module